MRTDQSCIVCQVATQEIDRLIRLLPSRPLGSILDKANKQEVALLHFEFNKGIKKRKRTGDEDEELDTPNTKSQAKPKFPPHQELFRYPMEGKNAVSVRQEDYDRLDDGEFLNDVVIEFMLKHLILGSPEKLQEQVHHFNTFFYEQLSFKDDQARKGGAPETSGYDRVKKWTSKVDLFSKKYIFVPINENMHWYLALIYNPGALLKQNEVEEDFSAEDLATSLAVEASLFSDRPQTRNVGDEPLLRGTDETAMVVDEPRMDTKPCGIDASSLPADDSLVELKDLDVAQIQEGVHTMDIDLPASFVIDSEDVDSEVFQSMKGPYTYKSKGKGRKKLTAEEEAERKLRDAERHQAKTAESQKQCHIIILDSLHAKHAGAIRRLKGYLAAEAEAKLQVTIDQKEIQGIHAKVPVQPNHCDCGIYLLYYVEVFLKDPRKYLNIIFVSLACAPRSVIFYGPASNTTLITMWMHSPKQNRLNADQDWFALQDVQTKRSEGKQLMNRLTTQYQELTAKAAPPKQGAAAAPATSANRPPQTPTQPKKTLHPLRPPPALSPGGPPQQPQPPKRNRIAEYREETKRKELLQASQ
ncbi:hypothetical protein DFJ77DRAFT_185818 [Powellomyces hirtus]|nr:hypothetical protein DFJ77DRAFT_185818 [Powellomyces hirtus]